MRWHPVNLNWAPIFEEVNLAVDHNSLLMDIMDPRSRQTQLQSPATRKNPSQELMDLVNIIIGLWQRITE